MKTKCTKNDNLKCEFVLNLQNESILLLKNERNESKIQV